MDSKTKTLAEEALRLPADERLELVGLIWDSLEDEQQIELTPEQIAELDRRWKLYQEDPSRAIPWEEAHAQLREELARFRTEREGRANAS